LEYIAFGIAQYQTIDNFIKHIDKWLINVTTNFKEIGYDHKTNQVYAVIDLIDNFVLIDNELMVELADVIHIIQKYGLIIHYSSNKRNIDRSEELSKFFEFIESVYPKIKGRYKGLGSSDPDVLREVVMDPRTRRIYQVTIEDVMTWEHMASIAGGSREDINKRKEILMNFKFTKADIDN
jgi:DNA gyrase/topoisomerase IV subunit B